MNEQQYLDELELIRERIKNGNLADVMESLDKLWEYKPIRLKWIVAKAEAMLALGSPLEEIYLLLQNKGWNLYQYPDIEDYYRLYIKLDELRQDMDEARRNENSLNSVKPDFMEPESEELNRVRGDFLKQETLENALDLLKLYYCRDNPVMYLLFCLYLAAKQLPLPDRAVYMDFWNAGFIREIISGEGSLPFLLLSDTEEVEEDIKVALRILNYFGKQAYWIGRPVTVMVDQETDLEATVSVSMENFEIKEKTIFYPPIELKMGGACLGDNRDSLIRELLKRTGDKGGFAVFTSGRLLEDLSCQPMLQKLVKRLNSFRNPENEWSMGFGYIGNSIAYLDMIHCMDTKKALISHPECQFSIVIPARNSAESLRYTLMTCLDQSFQGDYEIVLSDNSSPGNEEVLKLCKELKSPRIKYYRTLREYDLSKSFEFAILHAKGEFIIPIGSDDGIFPWALEDLHEVRAAYPDEELICWDRGFYAWPGFNGRQQNELDIPRKYEKNHASLHFCNTREKLKLVMQTPEYLYSLPMLYINSGFKKSYLKRLLKETGALWDGVSQDTYIAAINCLIKETYLYLAYPITMAGMSSSSVGAKSIAARQTIKEDRENHNELFRTGNMGGYVHCSLERLLPMTGGDMVCFYDSLLRAASKGIVSFEEINGLFDWKKIFRQAIERMNVLDIQFDRILHYCRYTASFHGEEFLQWFDEEIYTKKLCPCHMTQKQIEQMNKKEVYREGRTKAGGMICDASKYGVTNISEAVRLFGELSGLG